MEDDKTMKEKILWQSWELMNLEERNEYLNSDDLLDCYLRNTGENIDDYDKEKFEEYCQELNEEYLDDDFGKDGNWAYSPLKNQKVEVQGVLGLWNGKRMVKAQFDNLYEAIQECLEDYNIIAEDSYGNLIISVYHHDGQNIFKIKKVTDKGTRCLHFTREVFGCR